MSAPLILFLTLFFSSFFCFFFNDTATTEIYTLSYTLSLHDALPISPHQCWHAGLRAMHEGKKGRSEEHTSELQSHSEISYAVFCLKKKKNKKQKKTRDAIQQNNHTYEIRSD